MTTELASYYRELERRLECPKAKRDELVGATRWMIDDYLQGSPEAGFSDVMTFVGTPEELAQTYHETLGPEVTGKFRRGRRLRKIALLTAAIVIVVSAIIYGVYLDHLHYDINITSEETIIVYETDKGED